MVCLFVCLFLILGVLLYLFIYLLVIVFLIIFFPSGPCSVVTSGCLCFEKYRHPHENDLDCCASHVKATGDDLNLTI